MDRERLYERLVDEARAALRVAYAPYSRFRVGAAVLSVDGAVATGCNVENASYGLTVCAERVAVFSAVARGMRGLVALALVTEGPEPVPPCGACRQVLAELAPHATVLSAAGKDLRMWSLDELLPDAFGAAQLPLSPTEEKGM